MTRFRLFYLARSNQSLLKHGKRSFSSANDKFILDVNPKSGIATILMNSPPINRLDSEMLRASILTVKEAEKNSDVRGIILTSNFDGKVFSGGLNILEMYQKSHKELFDFWTLVQEWYLAWYGCKKPTVAAINGHSPAGGCAFAMMCDYRVMQSGAGKMIGMNETKLGLGAPFFIAELMASIIGRRMTESALLRGSMFSSEDALELGLVNDIQPLANVLPKATAELEKLIAVPLPAYYFTKMLLREVVIKRLIATRKENATEFADNLSRPEVQEPVGKYIAKLKSGA